MNELLEQINWSVLAPILALQVILMVIALTSCIREERVNGPKWLWILIIIFGNIIGSVLYFVFGRRNNG